MIPRELTGEPFRARDLLDRIREGRLANAPGWTVIAGFIASFAVAATLGVVVADRIPWSRIGERLESIPPLWLAVALPALAIVATLLMRFLLMARSESVVGAEHPETVRLQRRIDAVNDAFAEAATLMDDLRADLARQEELRARIFAQVEEYQGWLVVNDPEVQQYKKMQESADRERDRAQNRQNRRYFIAGILLSIPIGIIINLITG